tara:strand:- start:1392 stop:1886 length:495 start_codon:yes stop_codon:yes gene_type:complete
MKKIILILLVLLGLQTQAQIVYCDSISYTATTSNTIGYPLILAGYLPNIPGDVTWEWGVCTNEFCYPGSGINAIFQPFEITDTLHVCYDVYIDVSGFLYTCSDCDYFAFNGFTWVLLDTGNTTSIREISHNTVDSKIYDLLGRELKHVPTGDMYIRNNKLYISR